MAESVILWQELSSSAEQRLVATRFDSLTEEQVQHFLKRFSASEQFVRVGDAVFVLPEHL